MLGINPEKTIYDLVAAPGRARRGKLAGYMTRHSSGLDILAAPLRPEDAELVTEAKLGRLIEVARDVVRRDRPRHLAVLPRPDARNARPDRRAAARLRARRADDQERPARASQTLQLLSFPTERVRIVLNRANPKVGHEAAARSRPRSRRRSASRCPSDRPCRSPVNRGKPAVLSDAGSDFRSRAS